MKKIALHGKYGEGRFALVDDDMFDFLNQWRWLAEEGRNTFYAIRIINNKGYQKIIRMHHLVIDIQKGMLPDHIDRNGLNNQINNLRIATRSQNQFNRKLYKNNTSGFKGICWVENDKRWLAKIGINGKRLYLGVFKTAKEAAKAYDKAAKKYHGEFATLNSNRNE